MPICFVIQPFDSGKFDKRFDDVYKPAIEAAGLEPYRVDRDPTVEVPIEAIEDGIRGAAICLADITTDNPNVWYELGFSFASGRPVVMVCSTERERHRFPFDIQHRTIVTYTPEAPRDFDELRSNLTDRMQALLSKGESLRQIVESEQVATIQGLSQMELLVFVAAAGDTSLPGSSISAWSLKNEAERSGLTAIGFSLGFRRLVAKGLIERFEEKDERGEPYVAVRLSDRGWEWIEENESLFTLRRGRPPELDDNDVPF